MIVNLFYIKATQKSIINLGYIPLDTSQINIQFYYHNIKGGSHED